MCNDTTCQSPYSCASQAILQGRVLVFVVAAVAIMTILSWIPLTMSTRPVSSRTSMPTAEHTTIVFTAVLTCIALAIGAGRGRTRGRTAMEGRGLPLSTTGGLLDIVVALRVLIPLLNPSWRMVRSAEIKKK
jgi:hypothetical protein